ncbi:hypothetical protein [Novosphingobium sp. ES2-1]|uniref:hypothetical protein n=1 Tax=Novosphingobium sp. ES2-1 TaxID=2780074 RepID=UPI001881E4D6|nr:hypothetical protein [Novosphingobium sp. ES2-1]QOV95252.1 hypothetical protein IM701_07495 [Novosphingobium sp. ES2-1]
MRKTNLITLSGVAPVGLSIEVNGQRFDLIGHEPYLTKDGATTTLMLWQAECATCGEGFTTTAAPNRWPERRRCDLHTRPGKAVVA